MAPRTGRTCPASWPNAIPRRRFVVAPRQDAVPSATAATAPTQRDRHLRLIAERGRLGWQKASGYHRRALAEVAISRYKRVIGDTLRSRTDGHQATEVTMAVHPADPCTMVAMR